MSIDVVDLRDFYGQRLGTVARHFVGRSIRKRWTDLHGQRLLGVGYPTPYLGMFREEAERCLAFMPAAQGVVKWPTTRPSLASLVDEFEMPLPDNAVDRVLLVHSLEMSHDPTALLREIWRVLSSGGQLLAVIPNRRGLWARMDTTPFGHGRPYSRTQITALLRDAWFTPIAWDEALYIPPIPRGWFLRSARAWERTGATLSAPFAGVHIVEATKQIYRAIPVRREKRVLVPSLEPVLARTLGVPLFQEQLLRIAMTAADIPRTLGQPDQGFEGNRFTGIPMYDALTHWDLSKKDAPSVLIPGLATEWKADDADKTRWMKPSSLAQPFMCQPLPFQPILPIPKRLQPCLPKPKGVLVALMCSSTMRGRMRRRSISKI